MTNLERWKFYCRDLSSPEPFIEWAFYGLIAASLQRRVWAGSERKPLFPNLYTILAGPPGIGKGLIMTEVKKILLHHKMPKVLVQQAKKEGELFGSLARQVKEDDLLIPLGADASTYQALVSAMTRCARAIKFENNPMPYVHSSIAFCLEEISSLFRQHMEELVNFLLVAYDCGDYRYESVSRGTDYVKGCCLNFLGGTTPSFIRRVFGDELLADGFASRTVFVYATENRFYRLRPAEFGPEQIEAHNFILEHVKNLANLKGEVVFTPEAWTFLETWWQEYMTTPTMRANHSPKLAPYYARKNILIIKMAMVIHFMDHTSMEIGIEECQKAIAVTHQVEEHMHFAVTLNSGNPLSGVTIEIEKFIFSNHNGVTKSDLYLEFYGDLPEQEKSLATILDFLRNTGKVKCEDGKYKRIQKSELD